MKQKIKEALRQEYKSRLELDDERLDGVAAFASTFITDEAKIEEFVKNEATLAMLKTYQSVADKARASARAKQEPASPPSEPAPDPAPRQEPVPQPQDMAKAIAEAVAAAIKPLSDEIAGIKATKAKEAAVAGLNKFVSEWDYAKGFPKEAAEAKRIAMKLYAKSGESMTAEELIAEFRGEFDPSVKAKGVADFTKPFEGDGGGGNDKADFSDLAARLREKGMLPGESNN